ncbi:GntR family transcriptional regulator [Microbaculum marinum]|uniref:GntR family transcriptional regulator n=1 Tax=Microbaculum marinum TaxID=1764581 RepID=A0AAW9RQF6_9HYPH
MAKTELARKILSILRDEQAETGFHLREQWLADALGVSRSPVRTALKQLEQLKVVRSEPHQGYFLQAAPGSVAFDEIELPEGESDRIYRRIASERFADLIGDQVSVGDLVRRYKANRAVIVRVLGRMQEDGLVEKTPGHGWVFGPALNDEAAYQDSYRYRLLIEPAALLEERFELSPRRVAKLRGLHEAALDRDLEDETVASLFDIDAEFHETLADACGNRFLAQAIRQQTRLRRLSEYEKYTSRERHRSSFGEHMTILDAIEAGDMPLAAERMRRHIRAANDTRPDFRKVRTLAHRRLTRR